MRRSLRFRLLLIVILSIIANQFLASCTQSIQTVTETPTEIVVPPTATPTATPSETPQPPLVVLLAPPSSDQTLTEGLQSLLTDLTAQAGFRFQVMQALSVADFSAQDIRVVFALSPDPGIGALAAAAPQTQFIAIGVSGLQAGGNINLVGSSTSRPDQAGFLAGVIAAVTTVDFRVGVIYPAETIMGKAARRGFAKGVSFYCGLCQPVHPPYPTSNYPLFYELPAAASQLDWDAAIAYFNEWQAQTVYITPDLTDPGLGKYLANAGFRIISHAIPGDDLKDRWTATIGAGDPIQAIETHWADFLSGKGGLSIELPLGYNTINETILSPGKQQFINTILSDMEGGFIDTGVDPATGEWR